MKCKIYVRNITHLTDARYFAAQGVDFMGYTVVQHQDIYKLSSILEWVEGPIPVIEALTTSIDKDWSLSTRDLGLTHLHLGISCGEIPSTDYFTVFRDLLDRQILDNMTVYKADYYILKSEDPILSWSSNTIDTIQKWINNYKVFIDIPELTDHITHILSELNPYGIVLSGSDEEKTGFKDFDYVEELFDFLNE